MAENSHSIDAIISGVSGNTRADFSKLGDIPDAYRKARDQAYVEGLRGLFSDENGGLPRDRDGNVDSGRMYERIIQAGGIPAADAAAKLAETGFQQDRYRNAPSVEALLRPQPQPQPQPTIVSPPSANRSATAIVLPPLARGGLPGGGGGGGGSPQPGAPDGSWRGGDAKGSLIGFLSANNVPEEDQGATANILGGQLSTVLGQRVDPNAPLDMNNPQVRQTLTNFLRSNGRGPQSAVSPNPAGQPPAIATGAARPAPAVNSQSADPTLGGLVPPGYDPGEYVQRLEAVAGSGRVLPDQLKVLQGRIEGIRKALEPTPDMKNARAAGMPLKDFLDRADTNMSERDILTKSILPKLDKSQDTAMAARDEIQAIHRAREQLDQPGGIFSGAAADIRMKVAKVAEFIGVPNADKIAATEAFGSAIGSRTLALVKGLGAGAGISNADREFAAAMAGGNIKLDEKSIRRILDIGERAARARIDLHNGLTNRTLKSSEALKGYSDVYRVESPGQYQSLSAIPAPKAGAVVNGHRFLGGNPNDRKSWGAI
jgi:hypothetical protein